MLMNEDKILQEKELLKGIVKKGKNHSLNGAAPWNLRPSVPLVTEIEGSSKEPMVTVIIKRKDGTVVKRKKRKSARFRPFRPWEFAGFEEHLTAIKWEALKFVEQSKREREARLQEKERKRKERERRRHERALVVEVKLQRKMEPFRFLESTFPGSHKIIEVPERKKKIVQWKKKKRCPLWLKPKVRLFKPTRSAIVVKTPLFDRWIKRRVKGCPSNSILKVAWGHYPIVVPFVQLWRTWKRKAVKWNCRKPPVIFRGPRDFFFKPFNPLWRPMTPWEKRRAIERWSSRVVALDIAARGRAADLADSDEFPQKITAKRRIHLVARIFNNLLPALAKGFGWRNYPAKFHRVCPVSFWLKQGWKSYPFGYYRWFSRQLSDYHLQRYHWKLRMTFTVGTKYYKMAQVREQKVEAWRAQHMDKWLALVRDDPRKRFLDIVEANYSYKNAWSSWAAEAESQRLVSLFRPEAFISD